MGTFFDDASLVMIPSGVKEDKLYSIKPTDGSGDFTFSRGSDIEATRVNSSGLIEKAKVNLLLQSNTFSTTWTASNASVTGGQTGYDGSSDAWLLTDTAVTAEHYVKQNPSYGNVLTISVYAKANTLDWIYLRGVNGGVNVRAYFNVSSGTLGGTEGAVIDHNIESVGNGWYRCSMTLNHQTAFEHYVAVTNADTTSSYLGTGSGSVFIQDAALCHGLIAQDYIETTTTAVVEGLTADLPRLDYSGGASCPSLLLEPSRTNLVTFSEYFGSSDWTKSGSSVVSGFTSPEGLSNAYKLVEDTNGGLHRVYSGLATTIASNTYTTSIYAKAAERNWVFIEGPSGYTAYFDLANGVKGTIVGGTATITPMNDGWYRCTLNWVAQSSNTRHFVYTATADGVNSYVGDGTSGIYIYGAEVGAGSYPTSYIPTYGTAANRGADYASVDNSIFSVGTDDFTAFIDIDELNYSEAVGGENFTAVFGNRENGSTRWWRVWSRSTISALYMEFQTSGGYLNYTLDNTPTYDSRTKICVVRTGSTIKAFINGVLKLNQTNAIVGGEMSTTNDKLELSSWNSGSSANCYMPTNQVLYFESALTDAECIALTTI